MRAYLPTCDAAETQFIFGPLAAYLCEGDASDTLLVFRPAAGAPQKETHKLSRKPKKLAILRQAPESRGIESLKAALSAS